MKKLKGGFEVPILVAAAFAAVLIALGVGYKAGDTNVEYEGNLWCVSNYVEKEPTEYTKDGRPVKHPLLNDRADWIRKDQIAVDPSTNNPQEEAMNLATKPNLFERATKEEIVAALERGDKKFFTSHFNATATSAGPCWGSGSPRDDGKWINDAIREECLESGGGEEALIDNVISGRCGDLKNANAISSQEIKTFLDKVNSPMKNDVNAIVKACQKYSVNPAFFLAITGAESSYGKAGRGKSNMNPGNLRASRGLLAKIGITPRSYDDDSYTVFNSWSDGITAMAEVLSRNYLKKGRDTIAKIAPLYVRGSTSAAMPTEWVKNVSSVINQLCKS